MGSIIVLSGPRQLPDHHAGDVPRRRRAGRGRLPGGLGFSMPLWFLERAAPRVANTAIHFVVLRPSVGVCVARAAEREAGRIDDYAPYRDLYDLFEAPDRHIVRNDDLAPDEAARVIQNGLASGRFRFP